MNVSIVLPLSPLLANARSSSVNVSSPLCTAPPLCVSLAADSSLAGDDGKLGQVYVTGGWSPTVTVAGICPDGGTSTLCRKVQSTLGFETLDKAAALGLATATSLTDLRQYINSNLGFSNLKI